MKVNNRAFKLKYKILQVNRSDRTIWNRWFMDFDSREEMTEYCKEYDDKKFYYIGDLCS